MFKSLILLASLGAVGPVYGKVNPTGFTSTVSIASDGLSAADGNGFARNISFSDDGRYMVFESNSDNLVSGDNNGVTDIFLFDSQTSTTTRISVDTSENEVNGASFDPVISGDGSYVAFVSMATDLVASDTNNDIDVFLRDISAGTTVRVSVGPSAAQSNGPSDSPSISDDGDRIGFRSSATNLIASDTNGKVDMFFYDVSAATTTIVSVSSAEVLGDDDAVDGVISGNGSYFAFTSKATNMVASDGNACADVFVRDISATDTELASLNSSDDEGNRASESADISSDGQYVVFSSRASNLVASDTNGYPDIFLRDRTGDSIEMISLVGEDTQITYDSRFPKVSDDGRFVVFQSRSPDIDAVDTNNTYDAFIRDRDSKLTTPISTTASNVIGNGKSSKPNISGDNDVVGFHSAATNLISGDGNGLDDVFFRDNELTGQVVTVEVAGAITEAGGSQNVFTFTRYGDTTSSLDVDYTLTGTATSGTDYTAPSGTITIPATQSSANLSITITSDVVVETDETIIATIDEDVNYIIGGLDSATATIPDDDEHEITVTASDNNMYEDGVDNGTFTFSKEAAGGTYGEVTVNISSSGTATSGTDYTALPSTVVIPDGESSVELSVIGIEDSSAEVDESVVIDVDSGSGYTVGSPSQATVTLKDDDSYTVTVNAIDAVADESNPSDVATFRIDRGVSPAESLVVYYVMKGTATNGTDYTSVSGSVTISSSSQYVDVTITPTGDSDVEGYESIIMELLPGETYTLGGTYEAVAVLKEDSDLPVVSIEATDATASEDGMDTGTFTIARTGSTGSSLNVEVSIAGTATNGSDYSTVSSPVTISSGNSSATVTITGSADALVESTESVILAIESSSDYITDIVAATAQVNIEDDETPTVIIEPLNTMVFESGKRNGLLKLSRTGDLSSALTVYISSSGSATSGNDYTALGASEQIPAGETSVEFEIEAISDSTIEGVEDITVSIDSDAAYSIGDRSSVDLTLVDKSYRLFGDIFSEVPDADILSSSLSSDGRYVTFSSKATNLDAGDSGSFADIFIADTVSQTLTRITGSYTTQPDGDSRNPKISSDGTYVVFSSTASNLVKYDLNNLEDVFVYNRQTGKIRLVSISYSQTSSDGTSLNPYISSNGSYIVYDSEATNLVTGDTNGARDIFLYNLASNTNQIITTNTGANNSQKPTVSNDGNIIAFSSYANLDGDADNILDVYYVDLGGTGDEIFVSTPLPSQTNDGISRNAVVSADGTRIIFQSKSSKLTNNDTNSLDDIFVYDISADTIDLVSKNPGSVVGDRPSTRPSTNTEGEDIYFVSNAKNLSEDFNCTTSVYIANWLTKRIAPIDVTREKRCGNPVTDVFSTPESNLLSIGVVESNFRNVLISTNPLN